MLNASDPITAELLAEQVDQGQALVQRASLIGEPGDYDSWKVAREQWIALTVQALSRICDGADEAKEFKSAASALTGGGGWQVEYERDLGCVRAAIDVLISLKDQVEPANEPADPADEPADDSEPAQEPSSGPEPGSASSVGSELAAVPSGGAESTQRSGNGSASPTPVTTSAGLRSDGKRRVFLVHGKSERWKQAVVLVLERAGPHAVTILSDQPNGHGTRVEQFEQPGPGASYAVVLLTADEIGAPRIDSDQEPHFSTRACQGVVFEMGFLVAALTPRCVCVLYEEGVELPCDLEGIAYVRLDLAGTWQSKLLLNLRGAGFEYDLNLLAPV